MAKYEPGQPAGFLALTAWSNAKVFAEIAKTIDGPVTVGRDRQGLREGRRLDPVSPR